MYSAGATARDGECTQKSREADDSACTALHKQLRSRQQQVLRRIQAYSQRRTTIRYDAWYGIARCLSVGMCPT